MFVETSVGVGTAIDVGKVLWQNQRLFRRMIRRIHAYITDGYVRIAVFGPGGTGKTTLGHVLSETSSSDRKANIYELSYKTENFILKADELCTLIVPGGQERYVQNDWPTIYRRLAEGSSQGIINVVSWGYHSFSDVSYRDTKYYKELSRLSSQPVSKDQFLAHYLEKKRDEEIQLIKGLVPHIKMAKDKVWMITLVTKQDLWWNIRSQVQDHYMQGEYDTYIKEIAASRGQQNFAHEYISASLVMSNFQTNDGDVLAPTVAGYDQNIHYANLNNLFRGMASYITR